MKENAEKYIKEANIHVLINILTNLILSNDKTRIRALLPAIERRFFDLRSELTNLNDICNFMSYLGYANCQNDNIWNYLIKLMVRSITGMNSENLADCITGLGHAQRGSNQLWNYILSHFKASLTEETTIDTKILVIKSLVFVGIEDSYIFDKILKEEVTRSTFEEHVSRLKL